MIRYILFDLDETLYPATSGLMPAIGERMRIYLQERYHLDAEHAHALQKRYFNQYGTTLRGLMLEQKIDPQDYLGFVHDVDVAQFIHPDARLREVLGSIPFEKVIVTNADAPHAERVLARLSVADEFEQIFDIVFMQFECKPARGAYERVLEKLGVRGDECILVEDMARNLPAARELGIRTILLMDPRTADQTGAWFLDPAAEARSRECPSDANMCIKEIYEVADTIQKLANAPVRTSK
ncbi:MAG: pyrimidine 5'-nucleotidase [Anaerolineae bacterium]|nr:pyrimidine 5'-nucleotidase [Anaerolineae bacterium]